MRWSRTRTSDAQVCEICSHAYFELPPEVVLEHVPRDTRRFGLRCIELAYNNPNMFVLFVLMACVWVFELTFWFCHRTQNEFTSYVVSTLTTVTAFKIAGLWLEIYLGVFADVFTLFCKFSQTVVEIVAFLSFFPLGALALSLSVFAHMKWCVNSSEEI